MSKQGVKVFAKCLSEMQVVRVRLLSGDNQDIELGQLLETAKDSVKDRFAEITLEDDDELSDQ